mmetsp:Transcript_40385/g.89677  ORF Transcript_40385/g.89677 Transcript_40385/m.89677 type:complete len:163 (-) Transcript_40385:1143-1631(-)|eukprot:CAMPEP_0202897622 /NCGR_PEP_ID=MMETSP1392-20130828/6330_1 /ASSEMBLY_ACC=CAM_ASM_000868 /TAXON_ID=225041 /ORGANISM="Chlamydomonas chlamydogama, Strain SAG 11-48b" /LENGTH=162 /DNA_ID=CAMNT_0049583307 /DNA_START=167 /DNA_END=655 /DNA_ORIENTATION=+
MAANTKLYVGNLPWKTTNDELKELFSRFGSVEDAFIPTDRETGRPRGFGFVTLEANAAKAAIAELNETDYMGRTIRVNEAAPVGDRPASGRGGGRGFGGGSYGGGRGGGRGFGGGRGGFGNGYGNNGGGYGGNSYGNGGYGNSGGYGGAGGYGGGAGGYSGY